MPSPSKHRRKRYQCLLYGAIGPNGTVHCFCFPPRNGFANLALSFRAPRGFPLVGFKAIAPTTSTTALLPRGTLLSPDAAVPLP